MRWQQIANKVISESVSLLRAPLPKKTGLRILTYHTVGNKAYGDQLNLNTISLDLFKKHINALSEYSVVPLNSKSAINTNALDLAITFDDGYKDNLYNVAPLLCRRNIPFTVYIASDFIKNQASGFLSPSELIELSKLPGVTIGAHGKSHVHMSKCNPEDLIVELRDSKKYLEDLISLPVTTLAYPYGDFNQQVRDTALGEGYALASTSDIGINNLHSDPLLLKRCVVLNGDSCRTLTQKINGDWDWYQLRINLAKAIQ